MVIAGIILLIILAVVIIIYISLEKIKDIDKNIDMCTKSIEEILTTKKDIIEKIIKDTNSKKLKDLFEYKEDNIITKEESLYNITKEINNYTNTNAKKKTNNKNLKEELMKLSSLDEDLEGLKNYYNTNAFNYNNIYNKKFFNKIYKILKLNKKDLFDSRKLDDEI